MLYLFTLNIYIFIFNKENNNLKVFDDPRKFVVSICVTNTRSCSVCLDPVKLNLIVTGKV